MLYAAVIRRDWLSGPNTITLMKHKHRYVLIDVQHHLPQIPFSQYVKPILWTLQFRLLSKHPLPSHLDEAFPESKGSYTFQVSWRQPKKSLSNPFVFLISSRTRSKIDILLHFLWLFTVHFLALQRLHFLCQRHFVSFRNFSVSSSSVLFIFLFVFYLNFTNNNGFYSITTEKITQIECNQNNSMWQPCAESNIS